jgi:hypothetical protein
MADSQTINIQVLGTMNVTLFFFDMQPRSGTGSFIIDITGNLSNHTDSTGDDPILNDESIILQILNPLTNYWVDVLTMTTFSPGPGLHGAFNGSITVDPDYMPPGIYNFRAHYGGNPSKGLV